MPTRALLCVAVVGTALLVAACGGAPKVLTQEVAAGSFVVWVRAEGHLRATQTTVIEVSLPQRRNGRLSWLVQDGSRVEAGDVVARLDSTEMLERLERGETELAQNNLRIEKTTTDGESRISQTEMDHQVAGLELDVAERFQRTNADVFSRFQIIESEIDAELARDRRGHADRMRIVNYDLSGAEIEILEVERRKVESTLEDARKGLEVLEVRAPYGGLVTLERDWEGDALQVGARVFNGQRIAEIPDLSKMEAEVFVLETDAGGLRAGSRAELVITAHPGSTFGATVQRVDAIARPKDRGSPVLYFAVVLELDETDPLLMKPGQRVETKLRLAELDDVLVVPRQALFMHDDRPHVWLLRSGAFEAQPVEIGARSPGRAVIESGLEAGDVIALEDPGLGREKDQTEAASRAGPESLGQGSAL